MNRSLMQWVHRSFQPFVLVIASPEVDKICRKSNLTFADLLKPLGVNLENVGGASSASSGVIVLDV